MSETKKNLTKENLLKELPEMGKTLMQSEKVRIPSYLPISQWQK